MFNAESCRLLLLRSSSLRLDDCVRITKYRASQLESDRLQPFSLKNFLNRNKKKTPLVLKYIYSATRFGNIKCFSC